MCEGGGGQVNLEKWESGVRIGGGGIGCTHLGVVSARIRPSRLRGGVFIQKGE